jgi:hypothetical protein
MAGCVVRIYLLNKRCVILATLPGNVDYHNSNLATVAIAATAKAIEKVDDLPKVKSAGRPSSRPNELLLAKSETAKQRIAIVVAEGIIRYQMNSTLQHLIRPLIAQGHQVDYFLSISMTSMPAYRSTLGYMNHLAQDQHEWI